MTGLPRISRHARERMVQRSGGQMTEADALQLAARLLPRARPVARGGTTLHARRQRHRAETAYLQAGPFVFVLAIGDDTERDTVVTVETTQMPAWRDDGPVGERRTRATLPPRDELPKGRRRKFERAAVRRAGERARAELRDWAA